MPSIHPDYEYDIFISYRQNDNKSDGWVTNFVDALRDELEATLKNPVSIYFDENPHDGLLETHQVDASLAKKLKCLVFIPIISQTYCDESSFAWEHEFMPFIRMAKEDELGMNITLSNGNVTSRVLPVKIHDLDTEDQHTLESVLDGPIRAIDFIYKEPGVNRPLNTDDSEEKNINKTRYKNQLNKVANSLKDIGTSILSQADGVVRLPEPKIPLITTSNNKGLPIGLSIIALAMIMYWGYTQFYNSSVAKVEDVTIAVLAFDDQSPDGDQEWLGDGIADEILNVLAKVKGLQVTGKTSSFSFKGKGLTTKEIGKILNVSTVLEGSVIKIGNTLRITAQLIDVETDTHIWSKKYDRDATDILSIIDKVAQSIASSLRSELSIEEVQEIKVGAKVDPEAYEYYIKGVHFHWNQFIDSRSDDDLRQSEKMFNNAIAIDSTYADAYAGLADLYDSKSWDDSNYDAKRDSVVKIAYRIDPKSAYVLMSKGLRFRKDNSLNLDSAFFYYRKAYALDPNNIIINSVITEFLDQVGLYRDVINVGSEIIKSDPLNNFIRNFVAASLYNIGKVDEAKQHYIKILEVDQKNLPAYNDLFQMMVFHYKDSAEAKRIYKKIQEIRPGGFDHFKTWLLVLEGKKDEIELGEPDIPINMMLGNYDEALDQLEKIIDNNKKPYEGRLSYESLNGYTFFEPIRQEPRFQQWLQEAKIIHDERVAKYGHLFDE